MKISFTIPFYSTPEYLDAAIRSVLAQTEMDWELVVVDDRSPFPGIKEQVLKFDDTRIRYHLNDRNLGQSGNWNQCLALASGELVTILHADDMLKPNYADTMIAAHKRNPDAAGYFCQADIINAEAKKIFSFADYYKRWLLPSCSEAFAVKGEEGLCALLRGNFIMCPTLCFNRNKLGDLKFSPKWKCAPDLDFTSRLLISGGALIGLPVNAFSYRRHELSGTAVFRKNMQQFEEEIELYDQISALALERGWQRASASGRNKRIVKLRIAYFALKEFLLGQFASAFSKLGLALRLALGSTRQLSSKS